MLKGNFELTELFFWFGKLFSRRWQMSQSIMENKIDVNKNILTAISDSVKDT